ncbi:hypothetical protein BGW38_009000, partial [Lunasporangiospora selenospora]
MVSPQFQHASTNLSMANTVSPSASTVVSAAVSAASGPQLSYSVAPSHTIASQQPGGMPFAPGFGNGAISSSALFPPGGSPSTPRSETSPSNSIAASIEAGMGLGPSAEGVGLGLSVVGNSDQVNIMTPPPVAANTPVPSAATPNTMAAMAMNSQRQNIRSSSGSLQDSSNATSPFNHSDQNQSLWFTPPQQPAVLSTVKPQRPGESLAKKQRLSYHGSDGSADVVVGERPNSALAGTGVGAGFNNGMYAVTHAPGSTPTHMSGNLPTTAYHAIGNGSGGPGGPQAIYGYGNMVVQGTGMNMGAICQHAHGYTTCIDGNVAHVDSHITHANVGALKPYPHTRTGTWYTDADGHDCTYADDATGYE